MKSPAAAAIAIACALLVLPARDSSARDDKKTAADKQLVFPTILPDKKPEQIKVPRIKDPKSDKEAITAAYIVVPVGEEGLPGRSWQATFVILESGGAAIYADTKQAVAQEMKHQGTLRFPIGPSETILLESFAAEDNIVWYFALTPTEWNGNKYYALYRAKTGATPENWGWTRHVTFNKTK